MGCGDLVGSGGLPRTNARAVNHGEPTRLLRIFNRPGARPLEVYRRNLLLISPKRELLRDGSGRTIYAVMQSGRAWFQARPLQTSVLL